MVKKVLVIGSKGFIGKYLSKYLIKLNILVYSADVIVDYTADEKYFLIDSTNANYDEIFEKEQFDICINCSGAADVGKSIENPQRDFQLNTNNVFKILSAIKHWQPNCKFINLSSAAVYGNPTSLPVKENFETKPISPYGYHKLMSEQICKEFNEQFGIKTCSLRIFSAYGEGLKKQLFFDLYKKARKKERIELFGTGNESRDFIYIDDLAQAIFKVAANSDFNGDVINVANGKELYIKDVVKIFYDLFGDKINYSFSGAEHKGYPNNWVADISKLKSIGYKQKYTIEEGLKRYYEWLMKID